VRVIWIVSIVTTLKGSHFLVFGSATANVSHDTN
jgi:hypothetical protein